MPCLDSLEEIIGKYTGPEALKTYNRLKEKDGTFFSTTFKVSNSSETTIEHIEDDKQWSLNEINIFTE
jgi:hypothetical protein